MDRPAVSPPPIGPSYKPEPGNNILSVGVHQQTSPPLESQFSVNCTQTVNNCDMVVPAAAKAAAASQMLPITSTLRCSTTDAVTNSADMLSTKSNNACFYMARQNLDLDYRNVKTSNNKSFSAAAAAVAAANQSYGVARRTDITLKSTASTTVTTSVSPPQVKDVNVKLMSCNETGHNNTYVATDATNIANLATTADTQASNNEDNAKRKQSVFSSLLELKKDFEMNTLKSNDQYTGLDDNKNVESNVMLPQFFSRNTFEISNRWRKASADAKNLARSQAQKQQQQSTPQTQDKQSPLPTTASDNKTTTQPPKRENLHLNLNTYASLLNIQDKIQTTFEKTTIPPQAVTTTTTSSLVTQNSYTTAAPTTATAGAAATASTSEHTSSLENGGGSSSTGGAGDTEAPPEFYDNKIWREWEVLRNKTGEMVSPEFSYSFDPNNLIKYAKNVNRTVTFKRYYPAPPKTKSKPKNPQPLYI